MNIFVCDKDSKERKAIIRHISSFYYGRNLQLIITEFESADLLAESTTTAVPDIVLISIDGREAFQTAKNFRTLYNTCPLVIISNSQQFGIEAYNIQVTDYIIKPVGYGKICKALTRCEMPM